MSTQYKLVVKIMIANLIVVAGLMYPTHAINPSSDPQKCRGDTEVVIFIPLITITDSTYCRLTKHSARCCSRAV